MAFGNLKFDTLTTSDSIKSNTEKSIDTSYVFNGAAKVWVHMHYSSGTPTTQDSLNNSSNTDTGTGDVNFNYTNNMASANYTLAGSNQTNRKRMGLGAFLFASYAQVLPTANDANSNAQVDDDVSILVTGVLA